MFDAAAVDRELTELVGSLDPACLEPAEAAVLLDRLARIERLAAAAFLVQNRIAQLDAFAADVNVIGPLDEGGVLGGGVQLLVELQPQGDCPQLGRLLQVVHAQGRIGALVEVSCETDFVARTEDFKALAKDISMQVAAMSPRFVSREEIAEEDWAELEREFGDRETAAKAVVLSEQDFIKDAKKNIGNLVTDAVAKLGENIVIRRFARFELGETSSAE